MGPQATKLERRQRSGTTQRYLWLGLAVLAVVVFVALLAAAARQARGVPVGAHWHARYSMAICGQQHPQFPPAPGNVHTHGDGVIHLHPTTPAEAGRNANLKRFFLSAGVVFSRDRIVFPDGKTYRNGDRCPDGTVGEVRLLVNGKPSTVFERYLPQDGDTVVVEFDGRAK